MAHAHNLLLVGRQEGSCQGNVLDVAAGHLVALREQFEIEPQNSIQRQIVLVKVRCDTATRGQIIEIAQLFRGKVVDVTPEAMSIEATGNSEKVRDFLALLEPYGIKELVQSGIVALGRGARSISDRALRSA